MGPVSGVLAGQAGNELLQSPQLHPRGLFNYEIGAGAAGKEKEGSASSDQGDPPEELPAVHPPQPPEEHRYHCSQGGPAQKHQGIKEKAQGKVYLAEGQTTGEGQKDGIAH